MKLILSAIIGIVCLTGNLFGFSLDYDLEISKEQLQIQIEKKFPFSKKKMLTETILTNPKIDLKENDEFIYVNVDVEILTMNKSILKANVLAKSKIKFDYETKDIFLDEPIVLNVDNKFLGEKSEAKISELLTSAINEKFGKMPIYNLDNLKDFKAKQGAKLLKDVKIKNQNLVLTLGF